MPDPNHFTGPVRVLRAEERKWYDIPLTHSDQVMRGIGVADFAYSIRSGRPHRATGELAYHVLDLMQSFGESSDSGTHIEIQSRCARPAPLPTGLLPGQLDE